MMRGPTYDDSYITRKMASLQTGSPHYMPSSVPHSYGRPPVGGYMQEYDYNYVPRGYYPPPPRRMYHPPPPSHTYYDYDYGYGGPYGYAPPMPAPRISRYDAYLDDESADIGAYTPRYRPRLHEEPLAATTETRDKYLDRDPLLTSSSGYDVTSSSYLPDYSSSRKLPLDHVDRMKIRLKSLAYSLDPSGPVPDIILPERQSRKTDSSLDYTKKYSSGLDYNELPQLSTRRTRYYPQDDYMKDNLGIKCMSHYKSTRTAADYWKPKSYLPEITFPDSSSTSRFSKYSPAKWEEPDTIYGPVTDKKPFSKSEDAEGATEEKKERRKKKKSKEREEESLAAIEAPTKEAADAEAPKLEGEAPSSEAADGALPQEEEVLDEKERKRLEKKKRKAEREAAAKAAMEAELAALAAAEAELARLEAESAALKPPEESAAEGVEVKSESAAVEKCESPQEVVCDECPPTHEPAPQSPPQVEEKAPPSESPAEETIEIKSELAAEKPATPEAAPAAQETPVREEQDKESEAAPAKPSDTSAAGHSPLQLGAEDEEGFAEGAELLTDKGEPDDVSVTPGDVVIPPEKEEVNTEEQQKEDPQRQEEENIQNQIPEKEGKSEEPPEYREEKEEQPQVIAEQIQEEEEQDKE